MVITYVSQSVSAGIISGFSLPHYRLLNSLFEVRL